MKTEQEIRERITDLENRHYEKLELWITANDPDEEEKLTLELESLRYQKSSLVWVLDN